MSWRKSLTVSTSGLCVDLKMVNFLFRQQYGFTKYPCFLCMWDNRADLSTIPRTGLHEMKWCRVDPTTLSTILWWTDTKYSFHRCTLIKQFTKALNKNGSCFSYLCHVIPGLSIEKLKGGIFDGSPVRELIRDP